MKRTTDEIRHEVNTCPKCKATCLVGQDVDRQIYCAHCGLSFRADDITEISNETLLEMRVTHERHEKCGWTAFTKKP